MATFDGLNLFGPLTPTVTFAVNPRDRQTNAYPSINGIESLDGGGRGGVTTVECLLVGADAAGLNAAINAIYAYHQTGLAFVLVDNLGNAWPAVVLGGFQPTGRILRDQQGRYLQAYRVEFLHLNIPS